MKEITSVKYLILCVKCGEVNRIVTNVHFVDCVVKIYHALSLTPKKYQNRIKLLKIENFINKCNIFTAIATVKHNNIHPCIKYYPAKLDKLLYVHVIFKIMKFLSQNFM